MRYYLLMRFKNLGTKNAIQDHQDIIDEKGYVWAGWWAKPEEMLPVDKMRMINNSLAETGSFILFLADSDKHYIYKCIITDVHYSYELGKKVPSPEPNATPKYYAGNPMPIWFCIREIQDRFHGAESLSHYSFVDYLDFPTEKDNDYSGFNNTYIDSVFLVFNQNRTLILLRDKENGDRRGIRWINTKRNFSKEYAPTNSNSILLLSDLHFSDKPESFSFADCKSQGTKVSRMLSEAIDNVTNHELFASLVCAGDFTHHASIIGLEKAEASLFSIFNNHGIDKDNVVIVPGNHDMSFAENREDRIVDYTQSNAKENYVHFYKKIVGVAPNEFCAIGRKILLKNRLPIEIVGLNSCSLQQEKKYFEGMGYVGHEQLNLIEKEMGWKDSESNERNNSYAFRVLVLHHHLYPVEWALEPTRDFAYSTCLDAVQIMNFAARNRINLIIHGHKHQFEFAQMCRWTDNKPYFHNILGMGSTSSTDISLSKGNCIGILDFNQLNQLRIKILALQNDNTEQVNVLFSHTIPIETSISS